MKVRLAPDAAVAGVTFSCPAVIFKLTTRSFNDMPESVAYDPTHVAPITCRQCRVSRRPPGHQSFDI